MPAPEARPRSADPSSRQASLEATRHLQQMIDAAPGSAAGGAAVTEATKRDAERVAKLAAGLSIHIPAGVVEAAHIDERLREICRHVSRRVPVAHTERLQLGDEILTSFVGYLGGEPFVSRSDTWLDLVPNPLLPGLFEDLVGNTVPSQRVVQVQLPADYPVEEHRSRVAVFAVDLKEARRREVLELDDPMLLPLLKRGVKTPMQLREQVRQELIQERAFEMVNLARTLLLRELYQMSMKDDVPAALVDEEVSRRWHAFIGEALIRQGVSAEDQQRSRDAFADETVVAEARRGVWELRICEAVATAWGVAASDTDVVDAARKVMGTEVDIDKLLYSQPKLAKEIARGLRVRKATDILLKSAKVFFDLPPTAEAHIAPLTAREPAAGKATSRTSAPSRPVPSRGTERK